MLYLLTIPVPIWVGIEGAWARFGRGVGKFFGILF
jgi:hypothetical protein